MFKLGIAIVNDFKSVEGDRALGLQVYTILCKMLLSILLLLVNKLSCPLVCSNLLADMPSDQSLPVAFGAETAKWICVGAIDITQLSVAGM